MMNKDRTLYILLAGVIIAVLAICIWVSSVVGDERKAFRTVCEAKGGTVIFASDEMCIRSTAIIEVKK